ncbi:hypothetical protein J2Z21_004297 [Streptomyces griseochromogenes]|uniref:DUF4175 domain-containing protein n=1 Tax=Streptomyces griseochromogenes TaxID=68214 RepID=A0ABS4LV67_9ACTN|nr:hypothetical protein [Streptomyces griseochromogenes]MBP2051326.1 hypothetical protein [Streptomyces griseochromogenes]
MPRPHHPDDDRGCLRMVLAVPLALLTLVAAFFCWTALTVRPSGPWDDDAYRGIVLSCVFAIGAAVSAAALWALPSVRRIMGWWWAGPALLLGAVAAVRWVMGG